MISIGVSYRVVAAVSTVVCVILGAILLFWPEALVAANRIGKKWVRTDKLEKELNRTRDVDAHLFNIRKILGFILMALAVVFVWLAVR